MSVVSSDFERLKQFNLTEIYDPTPKPGAARIEESDGATPKPGRQDEVQASNVKDPEIPNTSRSEDLDSELRCEGEATQ